MYLLIVEDEQFIREGIKVLLSEIEDIDKIDTAENGEEAWQKILSMEQFPDILITDIRMPGMSGLELSERIRRHTQSTVIIFISGYEDFIYAKKAINIGTIGYITKPVDQQELLELVKKSVMKIGLEEKKGRLMELSHIYRESPEGMLKMIVDRINESPGEVSLKTLSEEFDCSPAYISLLFKEKMEYNFKDYVLDCRMKTGKQLLLNGTDPSIICQKLGYSDYDYFSKLFKRYFGESPSEYKKRHTISEKY